MSIYGPDLELANRLRYWLDPIGVQVVEIDGWQENGRPYATFNPYGSVNHHTAGGRKGVAPSLGIVINGRSDLPGPLCNVHQQRNDVVNCVAAGVANHAGGGSWQGVRGNQSVFGLEIEHCGYSDEPFSDRRLDTACRIHAAFISGLSRPDAVMVCQHFEWSNEGKIDFCKPLLPGGAAGFRFKVAQLLRNGPGSQPAPQPPEQLEEEDVANLTICAAPGEGQQWVTDMGQFKRPITSVEDWGATVYSLVASGAKLFYNKDINDPIRVPKSLLDAVPTVKV